VAAVIVVSKASGGRGDLVRSIRNPVKRGNKMEPMFPIDETSPITPPTNPEASGCSVSIIRINVNNPDRLKPVRSMVPRRIEPDE
jgi:hypothetical protein